VQGSGAVSVYTLTEGPYWQRQAFIKAPKNEANSRFGHAVALSKDVLLVARASATECIGHMGQRAAAQSFDRGAFSSPVNEDGRDPVVMQ
jgi:hypothetical protein